MRTTTNRNIFTPYNYVVTDTPKHVTPVMASSSTDDTNAAAVGAVNAGAATPTSCR